MRVSGVVRDAVTGGPIPAAQVMCDDGRNRIGLADAAGIYDVKTDSDTTTMTVTASGYEPQTVSIPQPNDRYPVVFVKLHPEPGATKTRAAKPAPPPAANATEPLERRADHPPDSPSDAQVPAPTTTTDR